MAAAGVTARARTERRRSRPNNAAVGLLREGALHAALKRRYAGAGGTVEAIVDGFVVDVLGTDGEIVEVQTGSFASARRKFERLVERHRLRVVYPVVATRWIVTVDADGVLLGRRRSPLKARPHAAFDQLVYLGGLVAHPNFVLDLVLTVEEEVRMPIPPERRRWPRTWRRVDRRLLDVAGVRTVESPADLITLVPGGVPERYTVRDIAAAFGGRRELAQRAAYCLRMAGASEVVGKDGSAFVYALVAPTGAAPHVTGTPAEGRLGGVAPLTRGGTDAD